MSALHQPGGGHGTAPGTAPGSQAGVLAAHQRAGR